MSYNGNYTYSEKAFCASGQVQVNYLFGYIIEHVILTDVFIVLWARVRQYSGRLSVLHIHKISRVSFSCVTPITCGPQGSAYWSHTVRQPKMTKHK